MNEEILLRGEESFMQFYTFYIFVLSLSRKSYTFQGFLPRLHELRPVNQYSYRSPHRIMEYPLLSVLISSEVPEQEHGHKSAPEAIS
jgi:hypothetical protein